MTQLHDKDNLHLLVEEEEKQEQEILWWERVHEGEVVVYRKQKQAADIISDGLGKTELIGGIDVLHTKSLSSIVRFIYTTDTLKVKRVTFLIIAALVVP